MKGDIYHILNRGVEKRDIFLDDEDFFRFRDNLKDFNDKKPVVFSHYDRNNYNLAMRKPGDELVDVLAVCLMPNHFHLLVQEKIDGGASQFSKKITSGHTQYFNHKNERNGVLFQGRSKKILVKNNAHFIHVPYYILANPIKLIEPKWKERGMGDKKKATRFLDSYKWVSFRDIVYGEKGVFSEIVNKKLFLDVFGFKSGRALERDFSEWLANLE